MSLNVKKDEYTSVKRTEKGPLTKFTTVVLAAILLIFIGYLFLNDSDSSDKTDPAQYMKDNGLISLDVVDFDNTYKSKTSIQQPEYWESVKGKKVEWSGKVLNIRNGLLIYKDLKVIEIQNGTKNFNGILPKDSTIDVSKINKGDSITLRGTLSGLTGLLNPWELSDVSIINK